MNEPCHTWTSHVTHMNEPRHTYIWVTSHMHAFLSQVWMSHVTHTWMSRLEQRCSIMMSHIAYEWVMSHVKEAREMWHDSFVCYTTHLNNRHTSHRWMSHVTHIKASRHTYIWVVSHMHASRHTHESVTSQIWKGRLAQRCSTSVKQMNVTYIYAWRNASICVPLLMDMCDAHLLFLDLRQTNERDLYLCVT